MEKFSDDLILVLFLLCVFLFFGWRASSICALTRDAVQDVQTVDSAYSLDVFELVGKNVKAGSPAPMGRISFPRLSSYEILLKAAFKVVKRIQTNVRIIESIKTIEVKNKTQGKLIHELMLVVNRSPLIQQSTSHCIRVGTCSALWMLGMTK